MNPKVLVVDDDASIGRSLVRVLSLAGFDVTVATDVIAAQRALHVQPFAVVISDERMPNARGVDFLETCAREFPSMTRLLLTGYADARTAQEAINRAEIFKLVFKPWLNDDLVATIREAAWRHQLVHDEHPRAHEA